MKTQENRVLALIMAGLFFMIAVVSALPGEPVRGILVMFTVPLFMTVLTGIISGTVTAGIVGAALPPVVFLLTKTAPFGVEMPVLIATLFVAGIFSGEIYRVMTTAFGAAAVGVLAAGIAYAIAHMIFSYIRGDYYTLMMFVREIFMNRWPGILLTLGLTPPIIGLFRRIGIMKALGKS